jgi:HPt (histidine-containing phosphotransfer) domain-containing protein
MYSYFDFETGGGLKVLDVEEGLYIAGDHMQLYKEILDEFADEYGESDTILQNYFANGDTGRAKALLLDIRGIAGNIGATALLKIAEELREAVINGEDAKQDALLQKYKEQLHMLLSEIKKV